MTSRSPQLFPPRLLASLPAVWLAALVAAQPSIALHQAQPAEEVDRTKVPSPEETKPQDAPAEEAKLPEPTPDPSANTKPIEKPAVPAAEPKPTPTAQEDSPAKAILRQSAAAIKAANSISFRLKVFGEGGILGGAPGMDAEEKMLRAPTNANTWLIRAIGKGSGTSASRDNPTPKSTDSTAFDFVWGLNHVQWVDHAEKTVYTRPPTATRGKSIQSASSAKLRYLMLPTPFQKELQPADFTLEEPVTADGVLCDVISTRGDRGSRDQYTIGQADHFPRRIEKIFDSERVTGRYVTEFTNVKINEDISEAYFKLPVPEGYKEDIQEAPKPVAAPVTQPGESSPAVVTPAISESTTPAVIAPPTLPMAPEVEIPLSGGNVQLSSLRGSIVVLDFFGTWALTSKSAHEELAKSVARYKDLGVRFISCAIRERNPDAAAEYFTRLQFSWDLAKRAEAVGAAFNVKTYPYWIVIDAEGHIKFQQHISRTPNATELNAAIDALLGDRAPKPEPTVVAAPAETPKDAPKAEEAKTATPPAAPAKPDAPSPK